MPVDRSHLDRFLSAVHRRIAIMRIVERIGLCSLLSGLCAIVLMSVLLARGQNAMAIAALAIVSGAVAGLIWGIAQRPTRLDAAIQADRQLELADLLSSALLVAKQSFGFEESVIAIADERCRTLSPSSIVARRYGARLWGGVGLVTALVLTLGILSTQPTPARALQTPFDPATALNMGAESRKPHDTQLSDATAHRMPVTPQADETQRSSSPTDTSAPPAAAQDRANPPREGDTLPAAAKNDGSGTGMAKSDEPQPNKPSAEANSTRAPSPKTGESVTGAGGMSSATNQQNNPSQVAGANTGTSSPTPIAPWSSPTWPADQAAAERAIEGQQVPAEYRALVRDYFDTK